MEGMSWVLRMSCCGTQSFGRTTGGSKDLGLNPFAALPHLQPQCPVSGFCTPKCYCPPPYGCVSGKCKVREPWLLGPASRCW